MKIGFHRLRVALICVLVAFAVFGGYWVWKCVSVSLEAEATHQAYSTVLQLTTSYIADRCAWPTGWDDVAASSARRPPDPDYWPEKIDEIKDRIVFDFGVTLSELA